ncbi:MAG: MGMT family protein [Flavobacteriaceae bacterium]|nr:MGMT family protein [Flavobacteriaceae bacterium]MCY4268283.1 MGMT family protein [Flavobacteriaceae bacterium]MCY4298509.1 MGMT family protein [Flavobacteriaceae bacterium]
MNHHQHDFFDKVYQMVKLIPKGRVSTYGAIARLVGSPQSARMVGWALNASHKQSDIPAHRVVNRHGLLTGKHHFKDLNEMQHLLNSEGIQVIDDQIVNFENLLWDPLKNKDESQRLLIS